MHLRFRLVAIGSVCLLSACNDPVLTEKDADQDPEPAFVGGDACRDCHAAEFADWQGSHHDLAMQHADSATVLGDFQDATFNYFDTETRFSRRGNDYIVRTAGADGEPADFKVEYTFGVMPLQQYLVALPGGRLQALPFTWDARSAEDGGQRWYHLYPDENVGPDDPLHWTGREQNWNYMCAECHSTNLEVNYDSASDSFSTSWSDINVHCEACHGPGSAHVGQAQADSFENNYGLLVDLDDRGRAAWEMNARTGIAERSEMAMRPPQQPESCGRCHSRRGVITGEYEYGVPLTQTHRVSLLDEALYFDDGQIDEEVFVYGSFVQSRMYQAGVSCSDCHNPHSLALVTGDDPNSVCAQCHLPSKFSVTEHHRHEGNDATCVDCHMQDKIYMGVDARRDHSFRVPRPDLSLATAAPNACNDCHTDQTAAWATAAAAEWWGDISVRRPHFANALHKARNGFANSDLHAVINNGQVPGIARGTALATLAQPFSQADARTVESGLRDSDPLVRIGAVRAARGFPPELQLRFVTGLLDDPIRSVRLEAVVALAPFHANLPAGSAAAFESAAGEFRAAQQAILSRPEAYASLAGFEASLGNAEASTRHYEQALRMAPTDAMVRVNFADALRGFGNEPGAESILREGVAHQPREAVLRHALGLSLVRSGRTGEGLLELREAARLAPDNGRYTYVVAIALNSSGEPAQALMLLEQATETFAGNFDIGWALATILRDQGELERASRAAQALAEYHPDNPNVSALLDSLTAN